MSSRAGALAHTGLRQKKAEWRMHLRHPKVTAMLLTLFECMIQEMTESNPVAVQMNRRQMRLANIHQRCRPLTYGSSIFQKTGPKARSYRKTRDTARRPVFGPPHLAPLSSSACYYLPWEPRGAVIHSGYLKIRYGMVNEWT